MPTRDEDALALALIAVLKKRIAKADADTRARLIKNLKLTARDVAELPDGTRIGAVTHANGNASKPYVADERAFLAWMQANQPHNVETIDRVRPAAQQVILNDIDRAGHVFDYATGEVVDVPGIAWSEAGASKLQVNTEDDAEAAVERAVRAGQVTLPSLLQLEAGT